MADLTITAGNVGVATGDSSTTLVRIQVGEAVTQGQALYLNSADSKYYKAQATSAATDEVTYIAMTPGGADGDYIYAAGNNTKIDIGATLTKGTTYVLSAAAAGGVAPYSDLSGGNYYTVIGVATATDELSVRLITTGDTI